MTVLFLTRLFYPHIGGVEKHVLEVSKLLVKKGHSVTVLTEKFETGLLDIDEIDGIKILRIDNGKDNWFKKFRVWKNLWKYRELIKKSNIVHVHDVFFWYLPFRFLYPSKKIFTTFHGYEGNEIPGFKSKFMHKIAEKFSKGNICVGDFLKKWYATKPNYVTYGGVNPLKIKNKKFKVHPDSIGTKFKILFIGRLEEETGIMDYLKALLMLKNKEIMFHLTVLGDGELRKRAEKFSKDNRLRVTFNGFVKNITEYLLNSDFVFVSRYLGILEALAYKKFVFAHYNNSIKKDYLKMTPFSKFISIGKDYKDLSNQIEYYLKNDSEKNQMINKGYDWARAQSWDKVIVIYLRLWSKN